MTARGLLRDEPWLRPLAGARVLASLGSGIASIVFTYAAYTLTGSILGSVVVSLAFAIPGLLLVKVTSRVTQDVDARVVTVTQNLVSVGLYGLLAVVVGLESLSFPLLVGAALAQGVLMAFGIPAWKRLLRETAPAGRLDELNAMVASTAAMGRLVGVLAGGWIYDAVGPSWSFAFNAVTYLPFAYAVWRLPRHDGAPRGARHRLPLRTGLPPFRSVPLLRSVVVCEALMLTLAFPVLQMTPQISHDIGPSAKVYSAVMGSFFLGTACVQWWVRVRKSRVSHAVFVTQGMLAVALLLVALALSGEIGGGVGQLLVVAPLMAMLGLAASGTSATLAAGVEAGAPHEVLGPVLSLYSAGVKVVTMLSSLAIGLIVPHADVWWVLALMGATMGVLVLVAETRQVPDALTALDAEPTASLAHHAGRTDWSVHLAPGHVETARPPRPA